MLASVLSMITSGHVFADEWNQGNEQAQPSTALEESINRDGTYYYYQTIIYCKNQDENEYTYFGETSKAESPIEKVDDENYHKWFEERAVLGFPADFNITMTIKDSSEDGFLEYTYFEDDVIHYGNADGSGVWKMDWYTSYKGEQVWLEENEKERSSIEWIDNDTLADVTMLKLNESAVLPALANKDVIEKNIYKKH